MSESIQTAVYKLRSAIAVIDDHGKLHKVSVDFAYLEQQMKEGGYAIQKLKKRKNTGHEFILFYKNWPTEIKWKEFISEIAETGEEILNHNVSINEGFILFVKTAKRKTIYAITGGFGHTEIQRFIDYQFGLDILSRLIKTNDKVLRSAKERNFVGGVLGSVKYFRGDYNLNENENFGNYYQELRAKLDKKMLKDIFKFDDDEIKRGGQCDAKSSFTIKKPVTFERAVEIVDILHDLMQKKPVVDLNLIKKLDKSDKDLIEKLEKEVDAQLYKIFKGNVTDVNFEVCHRYFDRYYEARRFDLTFVANRKTHKVAMQSCASFQEIIDEYKKVVSISSQSELKKLVDNTRISCYDDNDSIQTNGRLSEHLCAEIKFNGKSYFLFNQEWFLIKPDFENVLNRQCQEFIDKNEEKTLLKKWNVATEKENDFNSKHIGDKNTLVFDKITPDNIEACDILKWTNDEIYFIHVKEGFNNEMRNLGRQVQIAARRINEDLKTDKTFLSDLYKRLANIDATKPYFIKAKAQLTTFTEAQFLDLFENRKPVFVIAVLDSSTRGKRSFSDISKYDSNIAKFCLQQLVQEMRLLDIDLKVAQIEK